MTYQSIRLSKYFRVVIFSLFIWTEVSANHDLVIVIDPGHGGMDSGIKSEQAYEKHITLDIGLQIQELLRNQYIVQLTRNQDIYLDPMERIGLANHLNADLFISIHLSSCFHHNKNGISTFYWDSNHDSSSLIHESSKINNHELIVWDRIQGNHVSESKLAAQIIHQTIIQKTGMSDGKVKPAPLFLLAGADMPAILVEVDILTDQSETESLILKTNQKKIVQGLCEGIERFFQKKMKTVY